MVILEDHVMVLHSGSQFWMGSPTSIFIHSAIWAGPACHGAGNLLCLVLNGSVDQWICGSRSNGHSDPRMGLDLTIGSNGVNHIILGWATFSLASDQIRTSHFGYHFEPLLWMSLLIFEDHVGKQFQIGFWEENNQCTWLLPRQPPPPPMGCHRRHNVLWDKIETEQMVATVRELSNQVAATEFRGLVASVLAFNNSKWSPWFILNNQPVQKQVKHQ